MTNISWTKKTWNPIAGCSLKSPGCTNCYAMKMAGRLEAIGVPVYQGTTQKTKAGFVWTGKINFSETALIKPLKRKKPTTYFVNSMADLFHEDVPDWWVDRAFAVMALCPQHTFQVLTKRADRMRDYMSNPQTIVRLQKHIVDLTCDNPTTSVRAAYDLAGEIWPLTNVHLGVSVEDQTRADERREAFRDTPAAKKFVSYEPALGPVNWTGWEFVDLIISGGESGPGARPSHPDWHRETRDWCAANGVAYHFKQWGDWKPLDEPNGGTWSDDGSHFARIRIDGTKDYRLGWPIQRIGKAKAGRLLDGVEHDGKIEG
jgi:protein gp37